MMHNETALAKVGKSLGSGVEVDNKTLSFTPTSPGTEYLACPKMNVVFKTHAADLCSLAWKGMKMGWLFSAEKL